MKKLIYLFLLVSLSQSLLSCCVKNSNPVEIWLDSLKNRVDLKLLPTGSYYVPVKKINGDSYYNILRYYPKGGIEHFVLYDEAIPTSLEAAAFAYLTHKMQKNNQQKFLMNFGQYGDLECEAKIVSAPLRNGFICYRKW